MSNWMGVILERGSVPDGIVPEGVPGFGNGQGILRKTDELSGLCERAGLTPLNEFVVDRCVLEEEALEAAGWVDVAPKDWVPLRTDLRDLPYVAAQRERWRIMEAMRRSIPWFDPSDGLRTVRGLIRWIEAGVPHDLREALYRERVHRYIEKGIEPSLAEDVAGRPLREFPLTPCLWNLRTFELEIAYAEREGDRFNFHISY